MTKVIVMLAVAASLSGCRFWYKPVPVANAIGEEELVLAGDSLHVHRTVRFEVYGPNPEVVYDGYEQLNRAYRAYERHLGTPAPRLAIILYRDTVTTLDNATVRGFRDRGFSLVQYARPRSVRTRPRYGGLDYGGVLWPIAPTAARALLARFAQPNLARDGVRSDDALLERFPFWYRAAVIHLLGDPGSLSTDIELLREKRGQWLPLRDLLSLARPAAADSLLDPSRRSEADETTRILAAQANAFARFLVEREGPGILGRLAQGYVAGRPLNQMIAEFQTAPRTVSELEQRWRVWIDLWQD